MNTLSGWFCGHLLVYNPCRSPKHGVSPTLSNCFTPPYFFPLSKLPARTENGSSQIISFSLYHYITIIELKVFFFFFMECFIYNCRESISALPWWNYPLWTKQRKRKKQLPSMSVGNIRGKVHFMKYWSQWFRLFIYLFIYLLFIERKSKFIWHLNTGILLKNYACSTYKNTKYCMSKYIVMDLLFSLF